MGTTHVKKEEAYHELAGHPLPCSVVNAECDSSLRILRAPATHFPLLHRFVVLLYEAMTTSPARQNRYCIVCRRFQQSSTNLWPVRLQGAV